MPIVRIPTPLRPHAGGLDASKRPARPSARSSEELGAQHPALARTTLRRRRAAPVRERLREQRRHPLSRDLATPVAARRRGVSIIPAVAGG